jgi:alanyl aminopeptidase
MTLNPDMNPPPQLKRPRSIRLLPALLIAAGSASFACSPTPVAAPPAATPAPPPPVAVTTTAAVDEPVPSLRLPTDVRPTAEAIELHIDPKSGRFSGAVDIDVVLDTARSQLWLHGKDFHVTAATVTPEGGAPLSATWADRSESGFASLTVAAPVRAGKARIHVAFDAPFSRGQSGLYKAQEAGVDYAFTQFESIAARRAFPCFDEPGFKIPFTTTLVVPADEQVIANTHEVARKQEGDSIRVSFAPTLPLPSYLVAFAVGTFDIVAAPDVPASAVRNHPLPLRAVTARGRGKDVTYALAHAGEILATLETYTGIAYPYDKLDIVAVPGKSGAMENPGAVTFGEQLLLFDPATTPVQQLRGYGGVVAHEFAHQWTGDLVTMAWWDDTWLNEAFATWLGAKAVDLWDPKMKGDINLLRGEQGAMNNDALVSARSIRQPIVTTHDIENAFDSITYQKGGGVLGMFEKWAGRDAWQKGLHAYLSAHAFGNATADDFLSAESDATGKDVKGAMHTFLDQAGVPFVEASLTCAPKAKPRVHLVQSRFLPLGSKGDSKETWQIPICVRTDKETACTLMTTPEADLALTQAACPAFVFPNADGAGYYRFSLAPADLAALEALQGKEGKEVKAGKPSKAVSTLNEREKLAYGASLWAAYQRGKTPFKEILAAATPLAHDPEPAVAETPAGYFTQARDWLFADPARKDIERDARALYAPIAQRLGWEPKKGEDDETRSLRRSVVGFVALTGQDEKVRAELEKRGLAYVGYGKDNAIHPEAIDANLAGVAMAVVGEKADRARWDALKALLAKSVDETVRFRLLVALSSSPNPELAAAARELTLDPSLRDSEILTPLYVQVVDPAQREAVWAWAKEHYDAIVQRMPKHHGGARLIGLGSRFCSDEGAADVEAFFSPKLESIEGGPRLLASTLEDVRLCATRRTAYAESAREYFQKRK